MAERDASAIARTASDPRRSMRWLALAVTLAMLATIGLMAMLPTLGGLLSTRDFQGVTTIAIADQIGGGTISPDAPVLVASGGGSAITLPAARLLDPEPLDPAVAEAVEGHVASGRAQASFIDDRGEARAIPLRPSQSGLGGIHPDAFLYLLAIGIGAFVGGAVFLMRPYSFSARLYGLLGLLLFLSGAAYVLMTHADVMTPYGLRQNIVIAAMALLGPFALGWLILFLHFPVRLFADRPLVAALVFGSGALVIGAFLLSPAILSQVQLVFYLLLLVALMVQLYRSRHDLASRRAMRVVGASVVAGNLLYLAVSILPAATRSSVPIDGTVTMPIFVGLYAGIGVAILRNRRIVIDGWLRSIVVALGLACVALLAELAIVPLFGTAQDVARIAAFLLILALYIPFRHFYVERRRRERDAAFRRAFRKAAEVAFEDDAKQRAQQWRSAVSAVFRPIAIEVDADGVRTAKIAQGGLALRIPAFEASPPLLCRYAQDGARIFDETDVDTVAAMAELVEGLVRSRSAYAQGVAEERERIARDLHDDVSARLLSGLHRHNVDAMKSDIREAMGDIRSIVNGLAMSGQTLGTLLADVRHEAASRLESAGIALDWPVADMSEGALRLSPTSYRHVTSLFRETFSNIVRHADARMVRVECHMDQSWLMATIRDDGRGCLADQPSKGRGLLNCQSRAQALNGHYRLAPAESGKGCTARFTIDLSLA